MSGKEAAEDTPERWNPQSLYFWVLSFLIVGSLLGSMVKPKPNEIPAELQGTWETSEAAHADRFFELSMISVAFGTGNGGVSTGFVKKVDVLASQDENEYTIDYDTDAGMQRVVLVYRPQNGTLHFKNQDKLIWKKRPS
jgi:hypothetical protein